MSLPTVNASGSWGRNCTMQRVPFLILMTLLTAAWASTTGWAAPVSPTDPGRAEGVASQPDASTRIGGQLRSNDIYNVDLGTYYDNFTAAIGAASNGHTLEVITSLPLREFLFRHAPHSHLLVFGYDSAFYMTSGNALSLREPIVTPTDLCDLVFECRPSRFGRNEWFAEMERCLDAVFNVLAERLKIDMDAFRARHANLE